MRFGLKQEMWIGNLGLFQICKYLILGTDYYWKILGDLFGENNWINIANGLKIPLRWIGQNFTILLSFPI